MDGRKIASAAAASFVALALAASATAVLGAPPKGHDIIVEGRRIDPDFQRIVSYKDLNLALASDRKALKRRINGTARDLCDDLGYISFYENGACSWDAVRSTDGQFAAAVKQAQMRVAGLAIGPPVAMLVVVGAR
ncbi:UrcA family protein [Sphingomonas sp. GCM10030256]|uniref:UrcA family protein n=1 Tax=Sphingomonas sp. GCM10030256 TaxID=3273427 RepID=UPI0036236B8A